MISIKLISDIAKVLVSIFLIVMFLKVQAGILSFLILLVLIDIWLPIKHPCDYPNYHTWWKDKGNWWQDHRKTK